MEERVAGHIGAQEGEGQRINEERKGRLHLIRKSLSWDIANEGGFQTTAEPLEVTLGLNPDFEERVVVRAQVPRVDDRGLGRGGFHAVYEGESRCFFDVVDEVSNTCRPTDRTSKARVTGA